MKTMKTAKSMHVGIVLLAASALALSFANTSGLASENQGAGQDKTIIATTTTTETESRPDIWITTKVKTKLLADDILGGLDINVSTHDGIVQLSGWVKEPRQVGQAEKIAASVVVVRQVRNDLMIKE